MSATADRAVTWDGFTRRVTGFVRGRVDPGAVDDVVGEVLLKLVRHRDALESADDPSAWVTRVAANAVTDHHRRRAAERRLLERAAREPDVTVLEDASDPLPPDLAECLEPFLATLPAPYAEALRLTDLEGRTQADAARALGLSVSGMKSRVQRARAQLREALLACCEFELDRRGRVIDVQRREPG